MLRSAPWIRVTDSFGWESAVAFFVVAVDEERGRRARFLEAARARIPTFTTLRVDHAEIGCFAALWARPPATAADTCRDEGAFALVLGDAFRGPAGTRVLAREAIGDGPKECDGFHLQVVRRASGQVSIAADLLGIFPVYYVETGGVFLAASTPDILRQHPSVRVEIDPVGLVGVLLTNGLVGGRTLLSGVRRLDAGCELRRHADGRVEEVRVAGLPVVERHRARSPAIPSPPSTPHSRMP